MATKAERFKADIMRDAHGTRPRGASAARPADRGRSRDPGPNPAPHNEAPSRGKNSSYELEVSATTRPSRKSTRKSKNHIKLGSALRITTMNRVASPQARASRDT